MKAKSFVNFVETKMARLPAIIHRLIACGSSANPPGPFTKILLAQSQAQFLNHPMSLPFNVASHLDSSLQTVAAQLGLAAGGFQPEVRVADP
ncbi:MAG: hypothetical protein AAB578_07950, partial [Elusimicrobiota bacterium]